MNSNSIEVTDSGKNMNLPKPDPTNITVLTPKLPNKPILPWTQFDSPWLEEEEGEASKQQETSAENQDDQSEISTEEEKLPQGAENQIEPSATDLSLSENLDPQEETTAQQIPVTEIPAELSQLPAKENEISSDTIPGELRSDS